MQHLTHLALSQAQGQQSSSCFSQGAQDRDTAVAAQARAGTACLPLLSTPASERSNEQLVQLVNLLTRLQVTCMRMLLRLALCVGQRSLHATELYFARLDPLHIIFLIICVTCLASDNSVQWCTLRLFSHCPLICVISWRHRPLCYLYSQVRLS